ncbi:hypothetical protein CLTEP_26890 [Clostridium tepidiprofundi DSM 19306]|uniref:Uncharacterized protein n=1 Tax=Clostridium tepidiprofundi DSM 19306 TaxID=1121338 RepID=A0A151AQY2_9CLOT|nr:hypothetical protein CLTEP_26890 [Clostridium tepidiprofundi DSM 19306]
MNSKKRFEVRLHPDAIKDQLVKPMQKSKIWIRNIKNFK